MQSSYYTNQPTPLQPVSQNMVGTIPTFNPVQQPKYADVLNTAIPGMPNLTQSASSVVGNLLNGMPSTAPARQANAYFGAGSGMPGSDFVRNRGYDLYGQQAEARKQQGLGDLLSMFSTYASPLLQQRGQDIQSSQFGQNLGMEQQRLQEAARQAAEQRRLEASKTDWAGRSDYANYPGNSQPNNGTNSIWGPAGIYG